MRTRFIPEGALTVRHKHSSAVAYLYTNGRGRPVAIIYGGRRTKPDAWFSYASAEARAKSVAAYFQAEQERDARRQARRTKARQLEVGHVLMAMWGYEQTNVDFFQVTGLVGETMVEVRPIASNHTSDTGWQQGHVVPAIDSFTGEPMRRRAQGDRVAIDDVRSANLWKGRPVAWTGYH